MRPITLTGRTPDWFAEEAAQDVALADFDAVLMRKDPPFDAEYIYATHLLEQAEREGAQVINKPAALRNHREKLAIMEWPQFIGPTLVTRSADEIRRFHAEHQDIILKPLDGMGGMGIFRVKQDALNLGSIIETLNAGGAQSVMVQRFLPEITQGDKRVLIIDGEPVPFVLARIPQGTEVRGNLAAGGLGVARALSVRDREIGEALGPLLQHDLGHHAVLTQTLEAWTQVNGNLVAAAQRLGVHRNTLNYRMQQIQTLTGLDLNDAQHRLNIAIALMIWRLSPHQSHTRTLP